MAQLSVTKVRESTDRSQPIFEEFDRLADRIRLQAYQLFSHRGAGEGHALDDWLAAEREICWPAAELSESDGIYSLKVALAGFEPREVDVTATDREIMIKAAHKQEKSGSEEQGDLKWSEFKSDDVYRRVELPKKVDVQKMTAALKNGLLEITVPQAADD